MGYSPWNETFGACYADTGLIRRGVVPNESLVSIHTTEGDVLYPHTQFKVSGVIRPGLVSLEVRQAGLELWGKYYKAAIEEGIIDEYTAASFYVGRNILHHEEPSTVEKLDLAQTSPEERDKIEMRIRRTIAALRSN